MFLIVYGSNSTKVVDCPIRITYEATSCYIYIYILVECPCVATEKKLHKNIL
jgi:hypothetical protein